MEFRILLASVLAAISLSVSTLVFAGSSQANYHPPERISCSKINGKLVCEGFLHQYLIEDTFTADLDDKDQVFSFASGVAYYNTDQSEATVFYSFRNSHNKVVKLKSAVSSIRPDIENGSWEAVQDDLYVCKAGYMQCPITSLPNVDRK